MSEKEQVVHRDFHLTDVCFCGQYRREVDETGQRVEARGALGNRRNIMLNIENSF